VRIHSHTPFVRIASHRVARVARTVTARACAIVPRAPRLARMVPEALDVLAARSVSRRAST
jgi:hypothetical protein